MIALIQRAIDARVEVDGEIIGSIDHGMVALIGVEKDDSELQADRLADRLLNYRIFSDENDKMNLNLKQVEGGLLLVPQFTLPADTRKGNRPSFSAAAPPELGRQLFAKLVSKCQQRYSNIAQGKFAADMKVFLCNDGPVTFWLQTNS